jgi:hypothetical protein
MQVCGYNDCEVTGLVTYPGEGEVRFSRVTSIKVGDGDTFIAWRFGKPRRRVGHHNDPAARPVVTKPPIAG